MENVVLSVHLIVALILIGVVLLQRSEGGGLGMGGGGGGNISGRPASTPMAKLTWIFATAFIITSVTLTILAARNSDSGSVVDTATSAPVAEAPATDAPATAGGGLAGTDLTLPGTADAPATPPPVDAPAAPPANP